jgi:hypothetical protein
MKKTVKYRLSFLILLMSNFASAQNAEMADTFRAEGKIYVVVAIVLIVLGGLIAYLFLLDRKVSRIEKLMREKNQTK